MIRNPFKKTEEDPDPEPIVQTPVQAPADDDPTDPLGVPGQLSEEVTLLSESGQGSLEYIELQTGGQVSDRFLKLRLAENHPAAPGLSKLLLSLSEEATGFRDLLVDPACELAAAFVAPEICATKLAEHEELELPRPVALLLGLAELAVLMHELEQAGLYWRAARLADLGLISEPRPGPPGHCWHRLLFTGWLNLDVGEGATPADLLSEVQPLFEHLLRAAAGAGFQLLAAAVTDLCDWLGELALLKPSWLELAEHLRLPPLKLSSAALTDVGQRRQHNEDANLILNLDQASVHGRRFTLAAVADGMGGHQSGEVASSLALDMLRQQLSLALLAPRTRAADTAELIPQLETSIPTIDRAISEHALMEQAHSGMGTTLAGLALLESGATLGKQGEYWPQSRQGAVFTVGDSRVYLVSPAGLRRLTRDHSYVQDLVDSGAINADEAFTHPQKNVITRCIGGGISDGTPDVYSLTVGPAELVMIASDGLTDMLRDSEIAELIAEASQQGLSAIAERLVAVANERGGPDNITVLLLGFGC